MLQQNNRLKWEQSNAHTLDHPVKTIISNPHKPTNTHTYILLISMPLASGLSKFNISYLCTASFRSFLTLFVTSSRLIALVIGLYIVNAYNNWVETHDDIPLNKLA